MKRKTLKIAISILVVSVVTLQLIISQTKTPLTIENIEAMAKPQGEDHVGRCIYEPGFCLNDEEGFLFGMTEKV